MNIIRRLSKKVGQLNIEKIVKEEALADSAFLIRLNQTQLQASEDSEGRKLGKYASKSYARFKGRTTIDLLLTGAFYKKFFVNVKNGVLLFGSKDSKTGKLVKRFGDAIFGLNKKNSKLFGRDVLLPRVQARIRKALQL